jgi:hypothetical protein
VVVVKIDVTIGDLVLDGFDPSERAPIADAVERELSGLRLRRVGNGLTGLPEGRPAASQDGSPDAVARAVRHSIVAAISRHGRR